MSTLSPSARRLVSRLWQRTLFNQPQAPLRTQCQCRRFNSTPITRYASPRSSKHTTAAAAAAPGRTNIRTIALITSAASVFLAVSLYHATPTKCDSPQQLLNSKPEDTRDPNLPRFRLAEVRKHNGKSESPWIIHGDKVYDITNWISAHPGGEVILRAAGGSIDAYWDIFTIHKNDYVYDILSQYLIGYVDVADLVDGKPVREDIEDPFADDPQRHPALITMTAKPRNAETPADAMTADFLTPNDLFYVRNHMWVPSIPEDPGQHTLTIELDDGTEKVYTLHDLKTRFPTRRVTAVLQCSGNRRKHMSEGSGRKANGLPWNVGAISNACWEGVYLSDVLADAGFDIHSGILGTSEAKHVHFAGLEAYGASIPVKKAVDPQGDVLLAYGMNGQPLPRDHGFPLRAIVPGHVAARSVKWLSHITLSDEESPSQWQRRDYKCFGPNQTHVDWETAPAIQEMPVQSAITGCKLGGWTRIPSETKEENSEKALIKDIKSKYARKASLSGYAYSGGGREIVRVDVSVDSGKTWSQAYILPDCTSKDGASPCLGHGSWSWRRWRYDGLIPLEAFDRVQKRGSAKDDESPSALSKQSDKLFATFVVKATDESYNTQPESHAATWNLRGNLATAWHRMKVSSEVPVDFGNEDSGSSGSSSGSGNAGDSGDTFDPYEGWENI